MTADSPHRHNNIAPDSNKEISTLDVSASSAHRSSQPESAGASSSFVTWVYRFGMLLFVSICAILGVLLMILPWTPKWTDNYILISYPALRDFLENGFVRGMCTGLGAIDVWIGFSEATHYQEKEYRP